MSSFNTIYIKELIAKLLKKELTADEAEELAIERAELTEDQYDELVVEVLSSLEGDLPEGFLDTWSPDYNAIGKKMNRKSRVKKKFKQVLLGNMAASIVVLVTVLAVTYIGIQYFGQREVNMEIPTYASSCVIFQGDSVWMEVSPDTLGVLGNIGDLEVSRMEDGLIVFDRISETKPNYTADNIVVYVPAKQQCVIELEDGTLVRLNAQSYVKYPVRRKDKFVVHLEGEGYIRRHAGEVHAPLEIRTAKGYIIAEEAGFLVRGLKEKLIVVLEEGKVDMYSYNSKDKLELRKYENIGSIVSLPKSNHSSKRDTLVFADRMDFGIANRWTKQVRDYKNYPLRAYLEEMSRWYGFVVKDWDCFPKNKVVTAQVRYNDPLEVALDALRQSGVVLYQDKGLWSFCSEKKMK